MNSLPVEQSIFLQAIEIDSPEDRARFLDDACRHDAGLREAIESLIDAHDRLKARHFTAPTGVGIRLDLFGDPTLQPGSESIGPYKLLEVIGEGGMGTVWMAEQVEPVRRRVALKLIKPGMDSKQVIARFEAERQALAMMDHPNIARVFDGGMTPDGRPYFVMELVRGVPITEYCDQQQLSIDDRLDLFVLVCRAVQHAHQKGVIHRDLKPSNVLVTVIDGVGVPKVIDFGIAKATGQSLTDKTVFTGFHQFVGTPLYVSPEQAELSGVDVDTRSDIYSLGVLLYELLTGTTPFDSETLKMAAFDEMRRIIREEEPPRPSTRLSSLGETLSTVSARRKADPRRLGASMKGELDWVVMKALEKDRRRRYETANDFAADVMRYLTDRPVEACPPSPAYRVKKFVRRHRTMLATAGLVGAALLVGASISVWQAVEANDARLRAERSLQLARKVVDEAVMRIVEEPRLKEADFHDLRRSLLIVTVPIYNELVEQRGDDANSLAERASAYGKLGKLRQEMGEYEAARENYERMQEAFAGLVEANREDSDYRVELAKSHGGLEVALRHLGKSVEAEGQIRTAIRLLESLPAEVASTPEVRRDLAAARGDLGQVLDELGRPVEAEAEFRASLELREVLAKEHPKNTQYRQELGFGHNNLFVILLRRNRLDEAVAAARASLNVHMALADEHPERAEYQSDVSNGHNAVATILASKGRLVEAEAEFRAALMSGERLVAQFPRVPRYRKNLSIYHAGLAQLLAERGKPSEAETEYRTSSKILEMLSSDFPNVSEYLSRLADNHLRIGKIKQDRQPGEAEAEFEAARDLFETLALRFPRFPEYRRGIAESLSNLGGLLAKEGRISESEARYRAAIEVSERLVEEIPGIPTHRDHLATDRNNLGVCLHRQHKSAEAVAEHRLALTLCESLVAEFPSDVRFRQTLCDTRAKLAGALVSLGQAEEAEAECFAALELYQSLSDVSRQRLSSVHLAFYNIACWWARKSAPGKAGSPDEAEARAARAVKLLGKAVALGWKNIEHMNIDPDLDHIRNREDYRRLVSSIESNQ